MSYIGNSPYQVAFVTDTFSGNGSTVAFTMSVAPANTASVLVVVSGVVQDPSTYSVSGTTLTFSAAPPSATGNISCRYLGIPASGVTTTAYRTVTEFTATAGQTTFTPPSYTAGFINVYRNGALLGSADYTATNGTTVVLASAATSGDLVTVESFLVSSVLNAIPATAGSVGTTYLTDASVTAAKLASGAARSNWGAGGVLQVVNATFTTQVAVTSTSFVTTGFSASITPSSASNKILVFFTANGYMGTSSTYLVFTVYRGATNLGGTSWGFGELYGNSGDRFGQVSGSYLDSPATTSSTTYTVYNRVTGSTGYMNLNTGEVSTMTLMEIAA